MDASLVKILESVDELRVVFHGSVACENTYALNRVRFICNQMRCEDTVINEKSRKISEHAVMYFSVSKHDKYLGGADSLYAEINSLLGVIRRRVGIMEYMKNNPRAKH